MPSHTIKAGVREKAAERALVCLEYRKAGLPYRAIAQKLGISHQQAFRDVHSALDQCRAAGQEKAEDLIYLEREALDMAQVSIAARVAKGDLAAIDRWIKISESRRKLLGLDADAHLDQLLKLIDLSKLSTEQLDQLAKGEHPIKVLFG